MKVNTEQCVIIIIVLRGMCFKEMEKRSQEAAKKEENDGKLLSCGTAETEEKTGKNEILLHFSSRSI